MSLRSDFPRLRRCESITPPQLIQRARGLVNRSMSSMGVYFRRIIIFAGAMIARVRESPTYTAYIFLHTLFRWSIVGPCLSLSVASHKFNSIAVGPRRTDVCLEREKRGAANVSHLYTPCHSGRDYDAALRYSTLGPFCTGAHKGPVRDLRADSDGLPSGPVNFLLFFKFQYFFFF